MSSRGSKGKTSMVPGTSGGSKQAESGNGNQQKKSEITSEEPKKKPRKLEIRHGGSTLSKTTSNTTDSSSKAGPASKTALGPGENETKAVTATLGMSMPSAAEVAELRTFADELSMVPPPMFLDRQTKSTPMLGRSVGTPSERSESNRSICSEPAYIGHPPLFSRRPLPPGEAFNLCIEKAYPHPFPTLILKVGQGGTFGYGDKFMAENGKMVEFDRAHPVYRKVRHIDSFGSNNIQFIGTSQCVTCVAVYFELTHNRIFLAHINAWFQKQVMLTREMSQWEVDDIVAAVTDRLNSHARQHGWTATDVDKETVRIVCPRPDALRYAVPQGIIKFLDVPLQKVFDQYHGFAIAPGRRSKKGGLAGKYLRTDIEVIEGLEGYEDFPTNFDLRLCNNLNGNPMQEEWTYTVGYGWHQSTDVLPDIPPHCS